MLCHLVTLRAGGLIILPSAVCCSEDQSIESWKAVGSNCKWAGIVSRNTFPNLLFTNFTFMWPCIETNFFIIKPTRCTDFTNLFLAWNFACFGQFLCPSSGVYSLYTQKWYMSYRTNNWNHLNNCTRNHFSIYCNSVSTTIMFNRRNSQSSNNAKSS